MFFIWQTDWKAWKKPCWPRMSHISRLEVQKASCSANQQLWGCLCNLERFEVREAHRTANQSRCEGAECKPRNIGGKPGGAAGPGVTPVSHRCHVSSIRSADCLYKSPATCTPQCPTEVALDMRGSSWMYSDHSRNPASTSARATLSTSTPPSAMFVQHPQTSPLTRILVLPMRVCIRQTSHRGGSGSSQGRMERARRTRSWPSARSSLGLQVFKSTSFVCF